MQYMPRNVIFRLNCSMETTHSIFSVLVMDNVLFDFMKQVITISFSYLDIFHSSEDGLVQDGPYW